MQVVYKDELWDVLLIKTTISQEKWYKLKRLTQLGVVTVHVRATECVVVSDNLDDDPPKGAA